MRYGGILLTKPIPKITPLQYHVTSPVNTHALTGIPIEKLKTSTYWENFDDFF